MERAEKQKPLGAGYSSFSLVDPPTVFGELRLKRGDTFLDMACGRGEYALAASKIIGEEGMVYAIDLWEEGIAALSQKALALGIRNLKTLVGDVSKGIPIDSATIDVCLMATVLHDLVQGGVADGALMDAARVLKPQGLLAIIEFNKEDGPPGPSVGIRLEPEEVEKIVLPHGLSKVHAIEVGPHNYLMTFNRRHKV